MKQQKALTLKTLTKSNVWDIQESDVFRLLRSADADADLKGNIRRYTDIIRSAFEIEELKTDDPRITSKIEARGFKIEKVDLDDSTSITWALKKRPILRVTDLTYENIHHISAAKLMEVLDRNFGGGWESLSQSIQDIIESGFDISTTTLPKDRLHKPGGMYEKKVEDGYEVLEIEKGAWVEAIFAKEKPKMTKLTALVSDEPSEKKYDDDDDEDEDLPETDDSYNDDEDDDDTFDEDKLTEESYRTTFDTDPEDLNLEAEDVSDDDEF